MQGESPPVQVKEPYSSLHVAFILQNRCIQSTPAHNPRVRDRKKERLDKSYVKEPLLASSKSYPGEVMQQERLH